MIATAVVLLFTAYVLLDTFVIPHEYRDVEERISISLVSGSGTEQDGQTPDSDTDREGQNGQTTDSGDGSDPDGAGTEQGDVYTDARTYRDGNISICIQEYRVNDTEVYVADVTVTSPEYLRTALAKNTYGRNVKETTSAIAERAEAILAINGDFYGARNKGYVIRNGTLYRSSSAGNEDLVIYADGSFGVINESKVSAKELLESGAVQVLSFGPALVVDGEISVNSRQEVGRAMASNPRTAIGILGENHYVFVVADGRTGESDGLTLYELAQLMQSLGVKTAYNLDGGGSSTMVFLGEIINNPTTNGRDQSERSVSDIVCIGY